MYKNNKLKYKIDTNSHQDHLLSDNKRRVGTGQLPVTEWDSNSRNSYHQVVTLHTVNL